MVQDIQECKASAPLDIMGMSTNSHHVLFIPALRLPPLPLLLAVLLIVGPLVLCNFKHLIQLSGVVSTAKCA